MDLNSQTKCVNLVKSDGYDKFLQIKAVLWELFTFSTDYCSHLYRVIILFILILYPFIPRYTFIKTQQWNDFISEVFKNSIIQKSAHQILCSRLFITV